MSRFPFPSRLLLAATATAAGARLLERWLAAPPLELGVLRRLGVPPERVPDYKALVGDASYNRDPITAQGISDAFTEAEIVFDSATVEEIVPLATPFASVTAAGSSPARFISSGS